ncbi:MAG: P-II family nitrogen regulator [Clostridia bacterium]|nr:P-II family nitrogen regulator [Clostridia bacterium]
MLNDPHVLYLMMTVTGRDRIADFITLYNEKNLDTHLVALGHGTASEQMLKLLAMDETEKAFCFTIVTGSKWTELKKAMQKQLWIEMPGVGIAFIVPLSSIAGKRELIYLTDGTGYQRGDETEMKGTAQELLVVICNQGYNEQVMDAAREAGAGGGTVIHARGTGMAKAEKFLGISLASEKDVIFIVTATEKKKQIMSAIMEKAGLDTKAKAIVFSLPVEDTAGMRLHPEEEDEDEKAEKTEDLQEEA